MMSYRLPTILGNWRCDIKGAALKASIHPSKPITSPPPLMDGLLVYSVLAALLSWILYRRLTRKSFSEIPGPECNSFLLGNHLHYSRENFV
jgi:hypothetical protein